MYIPTTMDDYAPYIIHGKLQLMQPNVNNN